MFLRNHITALFALACLSACIGSFALVWVIRWQDSPWTAVQHVMCTECTKQCEECPQQSQRLGVDSSEALYTVDGHDHLASEKFDSAGLAPLTQWAQREIYKNQHPSECGEVFETAGWIAGLGSELHVMGTHLAKAVEAGRPLVWGIEACASLTNRTCGPSRCTCFFRELSNCTGRHNTTKILRGSRNRYHVPTRFRAAMNLSVPGITDSQLRYWWRAQSVGYLARLNSETVNEVRKLRLDPKMHWFSSLEPQTFPLAAGTINAHIRAGDKKTEMKLVGAEKYALAAVDLSPLRSRSMFISGDDLQSVKACGLAIAANGWTWGYTNITRLGGGFDITDFFSRGVDYYHRFTQQVLLQLLMSLEADAWIGTRGSNWNRLIDELRCVWVPKCTNPYIEVGQRDVHYYW